MSRSAWSSDLRFAGRSLLRSKGFTVLVALILGAGIGAGTALMAVIKAALLAPLPYDDPSRIAVLWSAWRGFDKTWLSYDEYEAWKTEIGGLSDAGIFSEGSANLTDGDTPERVRATAVGANLFAILGAAPSLGRGFSEEEDRPGGPAAAILSHELWLRRYGGDPAILGRTIQIDGLAVPVVGVMPAGFRLPLDYGATGATELYRPLATDAASEGAVPGPAFMHGGGSHGFHAVGRLRPGTTVSLVNRQLADFTTRLAREGVYPAEMAFRAFAVPVADEISGPVERPLWVLLGAVGAVLLTGAANVAGLLLVRGERRRRELAVRLALGAPAGRLTRLLFLETGLLAGLGCLAGAGIAWGAVALVRSASPRTLPRVAEAQLDPALLLLAVAVSAATALVTGVLPALQAARVTPAEELKDGGKGGTAGHARRRWRETLVTAEMALAVILVAGAGLLVRSVARLLTIDPGFDGRGVLTMRLSMPSTWYGDSVQVAAFWDRLTPEVAALPGVTAAGAVRLLPLATTMGDWGVTIEGYTPPAGQRYSPSDWQIVTPGYFEAMGLTLKEGRFLAAGDDFNGPLAMVVNRRFAELYLAGRPALGARVEVSGRRREWYTVVGVIDDVRHDALTAAVKAQFYVTMAQFARAPGNTIRSMTLAVRTTGDPAALAGPVTAAIRRLDPRLPVSEVRPFAAVLGASIAAPRFAMTLLAGFAALALVLSATGIFGVVAQAVALREKELGIRAALGARPGDLFRLAVGSGTRLAAMGIGLGLAGALGLTRFLQGLLTGVSARDPVTFGVVAVVTGAVALAACAGPARRAAGANPATALRSD